MYLKYNVYKETYSTHTFCTNPLKSFKIMITQVNAE